MPFGEPYWSSGAGLTDKTYTGQRDDGAGLMDYNARFFSPRLGRFISADTIVPGSMPVHWDRYAYVSNDPINYRDPSGHAQASDPYKSSNKYSCGPGNLSGCNGVWHAPGRNTNANQRSIRSANEGRYYTGVTSQTKTANSMDATYPEWSDGPNPGASNPEVAVSAIDISATNFKRASDARMRRLFPVQPNMTIMVTYAYYEGEYFTVSDIHVMNHSAQSVALEAILLRGYENSSAYVANSANTTDRVIPNEEIASNGTLLVNINPGKRIWGDDDILRIDITVASYYPSHIPLVFFVPGSSYPTALPETLVPCFR